MTGFRVEVHSVASDELAGPLALLEESLRSGEPVSSRFIEQLKKAVERGEVEVLAAWAESELGLVGVAALAFRASISAGAFFASVEEIYVREGVRRKGVGRALLESADERCRARGVSYVEVQTDDEVALFYKALGYVFESSVRVLSRSYAL
jgi:GNAT superfamily N-acetyltransferase